MNKGYVNGVLKSLTNNMLNGTLPLTKIISIISTEIS